MRTQLLDNLVLSDSDFRMISELVYRHCGINLHDGKKELVRARLAKRLRAENFSDFSEYIKYVSRDKTGKAFSRLIDSISTNLTSFFREQQHFEFLRERFLPALLQRKRQNRTFRIRAWSAGCSSGEEPYSIAITLLDAVEGPQRWDVKVLATDISSSILERAGKGLYEQSRIEPLSTMQRNKYMTVVRKDGQKFFQVNSRLKETVIFRYLNLMEDWPIKPPLDFIFCRNVMIYFDKPTQQRLINRYWDMLDSGAVLFTGHSESLTGIEHRFKYVQPTIYMKP